MSSRAQPSNGLASRALPIRHRRPLSDIIIHAPRTLRALVRADEVWLVVLAAMVGCIAGLAVVVMNIVSTLMHTSLFDLPAGVHLSAAGHIDPLRTVLVPALGGILLGASVLLIARYRPRRMVDPIEANALYGGRMSLTDSLILVGQTLWSNGIGGSVGMEAGYSQIGAAIASRLGRNFRVRRNDLRLLVGCGAAAAIAGAFNAPLCGSFYGIELVIGTYSMATLPPVIVAALCGVFVVRAITGGTPAFDVTLPASIHGLQYIPILILGVVCALVGIAIMRGVTLVEEGFRRSHIPAWIRPIVGGLIVGLFGLVTPMVLSSGHSALHQGIGITYPLGLLAATLLLKSTASAVSIGSGFRGGLFFASLFLGSLVGKLFAVGLGLLTVTPILPPVVFALVGMSALAVAIVGGPLTMSFLALESTGSFPLTAAVIGASIVSAITVRRIFGYSFATWRFHLRGEAIRSAVDIGWMHNLTVGRMMRREVRTVRVDTSLASFRRDFPLGATQRVVVINEAGRYAGIAVPAEAHAVDTTAERIGEILHFTGAVLTPQMSVKEAISAFEEAESDALAVVDDAENMRVIGLLTEQYALRRYSEELDRRRRELSGE
ncbi:MAG TPA: chloride channel protein [Acetobacteraceae bacterium]|nr:chloride channel protein [Acetobacteraceae bacterium]